VRFLGILLAMAAVLAGVYFYLKQAAPAPHRLATQAISTTGVEMDLNAIAQAERLYFTQNGGYGSLDQLVSTGVMNLARTERDGYTYEVETSPEGFQVWARHPDVAGGPNGAGPIHYPTISINQNMEIHQSD